MDIRNGPNQVAGSLDCEKEVCDCIPPSLDKKSLGPRAQTLNNIDKKKTLDSIRFFLDSKSRAS